MKTKGNLFISTLACGVMAAASPLLRAQSPTPAPSAAPSASATEHHEHGGRGERLFKELNLTDDQKEKIKPIMKDRRDKMQALKEDSSITQDQKKEKAKEIMHSTNEQIKAILTPDQQKKFEQLMADMKAHHEKHEQ